MSPIRILIVEDEGIIARDIQRELLDLGYQPVDIAVSGEGAVESAERLRPQLVLMDIHLTGAMDGIEAAIRIRQRCGIPCIFLTAYATEEVVERAKAAMPLGYIVKPFDAQSLRSTMEIALHKDEIDRKLRASERRYRALFETAHDAIITTDADGTIVGWSLAATELIGYSEAEAIGRNIDIVVPERFRPERAQVYGAILSGAMSRDLRRPIERPVVRKDGQIVPSDISFAHWLEDETPFISWFIRNITERQKLERQFRQAQKMEVVGRLAGGIAHDFNNVLTVINGTCDFVLGTSPEDAPYRQDFLDIREAGGRAERLTRQLLTFSRKQTSERAVTSIGGLAARATGLLKRLLGEHVRLVMQGPGDGRSDTANIDPSQFEQVVLNLAVNARDAMPSGGTLTITTDRVVLTATDATEHLGLSVGPHVRLTVSDTGTGMTEDVRAHLFEPFFTTKAEGKGTGLGLATVYGIVTQHGGAIAVESTLGVGTTFTVWVPAAAGTAASGVAASSDLAHGTETILLAEDDVTTRAVAERILSGAGFHVLSAEDGEHALEMFTEAGRQVDLVLTDVVMPKMDGPELAERIADVDPSIPVLYMSAYNDDHIDNERFSDANFVAKPFNSAALTRHIRETLDRQTKKDTPS